jgi:membrane protein implicated in regulation of membrane protease activity
MHPGYGESMGAPKLMIVLFGALALVVGGVAALALGSWWVLVGVLALHALGSTFVVVYAWMRASQAGDKPDPVTEARLEEERAEDKQPRASRVAKDREVFS